MNQNFEINGNSFIFFISKNNEGFDCSVVLSTFGEKNLIEYMQSKHFDRSVVIDHLTAMVLT